MNDDVYHRLAKVLDTLPNGFPATDSGVEIRLLKKIFEPDEAELFCDLRLKFETAGQIARRTGRPLEGLREKLLQMRTRGQILGVQYKDVWVFRMIPWAIGIFEYQAKRMDRELAELCEEYYPYFASRFFNTSPQLMKVLPVGRKVAARQEALPRDRVSAIIEKAKSFALGDCVCKKEKALVGQPCDKPMEVCLAVAPYPGILDNFDHWGRTITREEAYEVLERAEKAGLVHLTQNMQDGHFFICNCCGCCCEVLRSINELGLQGVIYTGYAAVIDQEACVGCGICADERCQVNAIEEDDGAYRVIREKCIGCGLCVSTCPEEAITLESRPEAELPPPPRDGKAWMEARAQARGVDYSAFK